MADDFRVPGLAERIAVVEQHDRDTNGRLGRMEQQQDRMVRDLAELRQEDLPQWRQDILEGVHEEVAELSGRVWRLVGAASAGSILLGAIIGVAVKSGWPF